MSLLLYVLRPTNVHTYLRTEIVSAYESHTADQCSPTDHVNNSLPHEVIEDDVTDKVRGDVPQNRGNEEEAYKRDRLLYGC